MKIHEAWVIEPEVIPPGGVRKDYASYVVQELEISLKNTNYRRARDESPTGETLMGDVPGSVKGSHVGPGLRS